MSGGDEGKDKQAAVLATADLGRTKDSYCGPLDYFGIKLWVRATRLGEGVRVQILDGRPE